MAFLYIENFVRKGEFKPRNLTPTIYVSKWHMTGLQENRSGIEG